MKDLIGSMVPSKVSALLIDDPVRAKAFSKSGVSLMTAVREFKLSSFDEQAAVLARALRYVYTDEGVDLPTGSLGLAGMGGPGALPAEAGNSVVCEDQGGRKGQRAEREGRLELEATVGKVFEGCDASPVATSTGRSGRAPRAG
eukprot:6705397-Pyramimonas_sp.AAC.1